MKVQEQTTIKEYQNFVKNVYSLSNDRYFNTANMLSNVERFMMRGLKGIRKNDVAKTRINLIISLSWFMSLMNQLHINIEQEVWERFPYMCSYCASCPCHCKEKKPDKRLEVNIDENKRPKTLKQYQEMFEKIYPASKRTKEQAGVHLAEEVGELSESIFTYRGKHKDEDFEEVCLEAADLFTHYLTVFNSLDLDMAEELSTLFSDNCHVCHDIPCTCNFVDITEFES